MKPIEAVLSFNRKLAFSSVTLSKEKWLVNWFCFTISKRTSFCIPHPSTRHFRFGSGDGLSLHHQPESLPPCIIPPPCCHPLVTKQPISNNVGGVKQSSNTQRHALEEERHFALVVGFAECQPFSDTTGMGGDGRRTTLSLQTTSCCSAKHFGTPTGTLETHREAEDEAIQCANGGGKCLRFRNLAEREGFEPSVQVLARTTV